MWTCLATINSSSVHIYLTQQSFATNTCCLLVIGDDLTLVCSHNFLFFRPPETCKFSSGRFFLFKQTSWDFHVNIQCNSSQSQVQKLIRCPAAFQWVMYRPHPVPQIVECCWARLFCLTWECWRCSFLVICYRLILFHFRDPNLWLVKCRMGEEKQTAIALMRKFIAYQFSEQVCDSHMVLLNVI